MARGKKKEVLSLEEKLEQALVPVEEQPYEVPENWCWTRLGIISDVVTGSTPSKNKPEYYGDEFPFFKPADLDAARNTIVASEYLSSEGKSVSKIIPAKSTAVCCIGSIGKSGYLEIDGTTNQQINSVIPKINPLYLYYFINTDIFINELKEKSSATTISIVNKSKMESNIVPIAPLEEQERIVEQIERLFAKLDEVSEKVQEILNCYEVRKLSILHKAFTGKLTRNWREKTGKGFNKWRRDKLKNLTTQIGDGLHGTPIFNESGEYYFVNGNNFAGKLIEIKKDTKKVDLVEFTKYKKNLSSETTVFLSINGTLGKTAFYDNEPIILGKSACYLNVLPVLNKQYLRYYFETEEFIQYANNKATGSTIKNLGLKAIRELEINVPSSEEQAEIVRILDELFSKENIVIEKISKVKAEIVLIKKSILAKAFRGELGTNNPNEESAIELLKQILQD